MLNFLLIALAAATAQPAAAVGFDWECVSNPSNEQNAKVIVRNYGNPDTLTVELNGKVIYRSVAVVSTFSNDSTHYQSPGFKNKNGAPSSLYMQVYGQNGKVLFSLSEVSYLPVFLPLDGECRQI